MQIVSCTKRNTGDSVDRKKGEVSQFDDRQTEEWDIVVDESGASSTWIIANAPLPNFGSEHPDNSNLLCTGEHQIRRVDNSTIHFQATVTYEGPPAGEPLPDPEEDKTPEKRTPEPYLEEWDTVESQEPIDIDINGDPIATVLGEQFDPPVTEEVYDIQMVFGKNVDDKNDALIKARGHTNDALFKGFGRGQCIIKSVKLKFLLDPDTNETYWRQTVTILAREAPANNPAQILGPDLWKKRIRAEGYLIKVDGQQDPVIARDAETNPSPVPVLHNKDTGERIDDPANAQWYLFETRGQIDFNNLNID